MIAQVLFRFRFVVVAYVALAAGTAYADIAAFNDAIRKGDYKAASIAARSAWPEIDKNDPDIAVIAREFGFAALAAGDFEDARDRGRFLMENGAELATPDAHPTASAMLYRIADYRLDPKPAQLAALRDAAMVRSEQPGVDLLSVAGWELLYVSSWNSRDFERAESDARGAAEFFSREQQGYLSRLRRAEVTVAAAAFLRARNNLTVARNAAYNEMADVHNRIVADIDGAASESLRQSLWSSLWEARAWTHAMASYLTSSYNQVGSNINTNIRERVLDFPSRAQFPETPGTDAVPFCDGRFEGRNIQYPANREFSGHVGAVIVRVETAANGKVTNAEVLASIPMDVFGRAVVDRVKTWTYKPTRAASGTNCRLNTRNYIYTVEFRIG